MPLPDGRGIFYTYENRQSIYDVGLRSGQVDKVIFFLST
jgi:hypothetical protein